MFNKIWRVSSLTLWASSESSWTSLSINRMALISFREITSNLWPYLNFLSWFPWGFEAIHTCESLTSMVEESSWGKELLNRFSVEVLPLDQGSAGRGEPLVSDCSLESLRESNWLACAESFLVVRMLRKCLLSYATPIWFHSKRSGEL